MYGPGAKTKTADWFADDELSSAKEKARAFLGAHYAAETMERIMSFAVDCSRQRDIVMCKVCQDDMESIGSLRRCDLAVDPWSWVVEGDEVRVQERWHQHLQEGPAPVIPLQEPLSRPQLGLPLHQLAPSMAALADF